MPSRWDAATHGWSRRVFHYPLPTLMSRNFRLPCTIELQPLSLTPLKMRKVEFASRFVVLWLLGTRVAGVSRLGEDEGELEGTTYCTRLRGTFARRRRQIPTVVRLPATPMATVSSGKNHHDRSTPNCASAHSRVPARKNIRAATATAQAQPVSRPEARETPGIRWAHTRPVATDSSGKKRKAPGMASNQISNGLINGSPSASCTSGMSGNRRVGAAVFGAQFLDASSSDCSPIRPPVRRRPIVL